MRTGIASMLCFLLFTISAFAQANIVPVKVVGRHYNRDLSLWEVYPISVYVQDKKRDAAGLEVDDDWLIAGEGITEAKTRLSSYPPQEIIKALKKALEWVKTAKKEKMETTKSLPGFEENPESEWRGMQLEFFSANHGQQTDVILYLPQWKLQTQLDLYLNPDQVKQLIAALEGMENTRKHLQEQEEKANKLK